MIGVRFFRACGFARFTAAAFMFLFLFAQVSFLYADEPKAKSKARGGTLTVITVPERSEVWIDGGYAGLTPIRDKRMAAGTYNLRLVDPQGQTSASETIFISDGERLLVERSLEGSYGKLRIDSHPQGAEVAIIADLGKTPLVNDYLTPGEYSIELRHPDSKYLPIKKEVVFAAGQTVTISEKFEKPPVLTRKKLIQLGLGTGAVLGWTWAVIEQHNTTSAKQKSVYYPADEREDMKKKSKNAGIRRTAAICAASAFSVTLQVTTFIW